MARKKEVQVGQFDIFSQVAHLDKLIQQPEVLNCDGQKVIHFSISEDNKQIPGYIDEAKKQARKLLPEAKSLDKPPWLDAMWQARRRKIREGLL